jgi:N6-adenosine-specific RNA methylase IME4|tara:strand:- start:4782 stop:5333 length:552 start_codon:yes stop_codon:yes gene_type:complete
MYNVILSDPPWNFKVRSEKGMGKSAENHYDTMSLDEIKAIPVNDWANESCVLLMWTTDPFLEESFNVIKSWGFTYRTMGFVWAKTNRCSPGYFMGMGYYTRSNPEYCLLAARGTPKRKARNIRKLVVDPIREHSRKPDRIYQDIEDLFDGPYLEMFARTSRPGWKQWGNETMKFDSSPSASLF